VKNSDIVKVESFVGFGRFLIFHQSGIVGRNERHAQGHTRLSLGGFGRNRSHGHARGQRATFTRDRQVYATSTSATESRHVGKS